MKLKKTACGLFLFLSVITGTVFTLLIYDADKAEQLFGKIIGGILAVGFFFGMGILALAIFFLSACFARSLWSIALSSVMAGVFMLLECALLKWLAGVGSATSGSQSGYAVLNWIGCFFIFCFVIYFPLALWRLNKRKIGKSPL